jgi:hypothetical protein
MKATVMLYTDIVNEMEAWDAVAEFVTPKATFVTMTQKGTEF